MYSLVNNLIPAFLLAFAATTSMAAPTDSTASDLEARALGINCRGSFFCGSGGSINANLQTALSNTGGCSANPGQQMYCSGNFCAFTQGTDEDLDPETAQTLLTSLQAHGCSDCGSVPLNFPFSNDPSGGILTVNYVSDTHGCSGICNTICDK